MCGTYHINPDMIPAGEQVEVPCPGDPCAGKPCPHGKTIIIHKDAYSIPMSGGAIYTCEECARWDDNGLKENR